MVIGYGIIAVPTGIVGVEIAKSVSNKPKDPNDTSPQNEKFICSNCNTSDHLPHSHFCYNCGNKL